MIKEVAFATALCFKDTLRKQLACEVQRSTRWPAATSTATKSGGAGGDTTVKTSLESVEFGGELL